MNHGETTEIVVPAMTQDVLNGFKNIIVPILRARENAEVTAYSRRSVVYGRSQCRHWRVEMKVCAGEARPVEEPVGEQPAEETTTPVATAYDLRLLVNYSENSVETTKTSKWTIDYWFIEKRWLWND